MVQVTRGIAISAGVIGIIGSVFGFGVIVSAFVVSAKLKGMISPYWSGFATLIPGILGVVILITKNHCTLIAYLVLNIIILIINLISCALTGLAYAIWGIVLAIYKQYSCTELLGKCVCTKKSGGSKTHSYNVEKCSDLTAVGDLLLAMTVLALFAAICNFAGSIVGCMGACCQQYKQQTTVGVVMVPVSQQQQHTTTVIQQGPPPTYPQVNHGAVVYP